MFIAGASVIPFGEAKAAGPAWHQRFCQQHSPILPLHPPLQQQLVILRTRPRITLWNHCKRRSDLACFSSSSAWTWSNFQHANLKTLLQPTLPVPRSLGTSAPLPFFFFFSALWHKFVHRGVASKRKREKKIFMPQGLALSTKHPNAAWLYHEIIIELIIPLSPPATSAPTTQCHHENCWGMKRKMG